MPHYRSPKAISAFDAKFEAQKIAFASISFQVAKCVLQFDVLAHIDRHKNTGCTLEQLVSLTPLNEYALSVLLDMALSMGLIWQRENHYILDKTGDFLLNDSMTAINLNFVQDICYQGLFELDKSLLQGKPKGLEVFGTWDTIYPALSQLPESAKQSWFAFDHYYSDHAFVQLLPLVFAHQPQHLVDIGGNTGKWAIACTQYDPHVLVTIMDLPSQIAVANEKARALGLGSRITGFTTDLLAIDAPFVTGGDIYWMSQFLDCFSKPQISSILTKLARVMAPNSKLFIVETFWDRQAHEASAYCVNATSLYFTALANGNSRMYHSKDMLNLVYDAGFYVDEDIDHIGLGHTLLICKLQPC